MPPVARIALAVLVGVVTAAALFGSARLAVADHQSLLSRLDTLPAEQRLLAAQKAVSLNPYNDAYRTQLGLAYLALASDRLAAGDQGFSEASSLLVQAESAYREAIAFNPAEYDNYVYLAGLYNNMGRLIDPAYYPKAEAAARDALRKTPLGSTAMVELARALIGMGRSAEAAEASGGGRHPGSPYDLGFRTAPDD